MTHPSRGGSFWWSLVQKILQNVLLPLSSHLGVSGIDSAGLCSQEKCPEARQVDFTKTRGSLSLSEQEEFNGLLTLCYGYGEGNRPREIQGLAQGHTGVRSNALARP